MTKAPPREHRSARVLRFALIASALLHLIVLPLALWTVALRLPLIKQQTPREETMASTAITLERRPIPRPPSNAAPHESQSRSRPNPSVTLSPNPSVTLSPSKGRPTPRPIPSPAPPVILSQSKDATPIPQPTQAQHSASAPAKSTLQQQLDAQQAQYAKTVAQLNAQNNVRSIATLPPATPSSKHLSSFDQSGTQNAFLAGHGVLQPVKSWHPDAQHACYYVTYSFEYANGATEDGNVPWPICYPNSNDEFKKPPHPIDLATPQPGFTTTKFLTPLLTYYYNHKQGPPPQ